MQVQRHGQQVGPATLDAAQLARVSGGIEDGKIDRVNDDAT